jgi:hypothetical protein
VLNAVEIEEAVSALAEQPFDPAEFPYAFLQAFGNKETTLRKLRSGDTNKSDLGGVLQRNNIHIAIAPRGEVTATLAELRASPATAKHKVKFILATDGEWLEAEDLTGGAPLACDFVRLPDYFGFFLPLAGISTVREIVENAFDIRATSKLNRLYVELLKENPEWGTDERRSDMNHFMARLIFSFFAEDTGIFAEDRLFTETVSQMSARDSSNTHEVIGALFRAMNTRHEDREAGGIPRWADRFPYVNGGLFSTEIGVPRFTRTARSYLLQVGSLDWKQINPDIFGSMIQAVADEEERGALGMHYTSVPNILKVLNPLFLDDLRAKLEEAGDNPRKLLNLRNRISRIRVFDPACGSGNFLVIAYKAMRELEHEINRRRGELGRKTDIPLTNFRGIELRDFAAQIARLALIIAEFQCDVLYRGQQDAINDFLPLDAESWITCGNALQIDWLSVCPPTGTGVKLVGEDLFSTPLAQAEIDFENQGGETFICGNPPYRGSQTQTKEQKADLAAVFASYGISSKQIDYVGGWIIKAAAYSQSTRAETAFVSTNSVCQGRIVPILWPAILGLGSHIRFAHTSFKWSNLAAHNAGVTVAIIGLSTDAGKKRLLYDLGRDGEISVREATNITPYLTIGDNMVVDGQRASISGLPDMSFGNMPNDGGILLLDMDEAHTAVYREAVPALYVRPFVGSQEFIRGTQRRCIWVTDIDYNTARINAWLAGRFEEVRANRARSDRATTNELADVPYRFGEVRQTGDETVIIVPSVSSESREYLPVGYLPQGTIVSNLAFALYDAPLWNMALVASRLHLVWIATVCGKLETRYRYSNTLGWNTFPVPPLTEQNKADLTRCAEDILLAREAHYPATIADLYDPEQMPTNLREAHERNDEVLERIYIGRKFRNDTERLEKLFDMYTKMTGSAPRPTSGRSRRKTG